MRNAVMVSLLCLGLITAPAVAQPRDEEKDALKDMVRVLQADLKLAQAEQEKAKALAEELTTQNEALVAQTAELIDKNSALASRNIDLETQITTLTAQLEAGPDRSVVTAPGSETTIDTPDEPTDAPSLGLTAIHVDEDWIADLKDARIATPPQRGMYISSVWPGSPAAKAGLRTGDILLTGADNPITDEDAFLAWIEALPIDAVVSVQRLRLNDEGNEWIRETVELTPAPAMAVYREALRRKYITLDGEWLELPEMDLTRPSSQSEPYAPKGSWSDAENAEARKAWETGLPLIAAGEYGAILGCQVRKVQGEGDVLIDITSRDLPASSHTARNTTTAVRLVGVETDDLKEGQRYEPPAIAIVSLWKDGEFFGGDEAIYLAVPLSTITDGLSEADLAELERFIADN